MEVKTILAQMLQSSPKLYEEILDTRGFAYYFNELIKCALVGEDAQPYVISMQERCVALVEAWDDIDSQTDGLVKAIRALPISL